MTPTNDQERLSRTEKVTGTILLITLVVGIWSLLSRRAEQSFAPILGAAAGILALSFIVFMIVSGRHKRVLVPNERTWKAARENRLEFSTGYTAAYLLAQWLSGQPIQLGMLALFLVATYVIPLLLIRYLPYRFKFVDRERSQPS